MKQKAQNRILKEEALEAERQEVRSLSLPLALLQGSVLFFCHSSGIIASNPATSAMNLPSPSCFSLLVTYAMLHECHLCAMLPSSSAVLHP